MGGTTEYDHRKSLNKVRENMNKRVKDIIEQFSKIDKIKVEALKKTEEMRRSIEDDVGKVEDAISRSQGLTTDSKRALTSEIATLKDEVEKKSTELRTRASKISVP